MFSNWSSVKKISSVITLTVLLTACEETVTEVTVSKPVLTQPQVVLKTLLESSFTPEVNTVGVIESAHEVDLSVNFSAAVTHLYVKEGQKVERGQLLLALDASKLKLKLSAAKQALQKAQSRMNEATDNLKRREVLANQNNLSKEALDAARHDFERSKADMAEAKAAYQLAQRDLDDTRLYSPANGIVDKQWLEIGEMAQPGERLLSLQSNETLEVQTFVSERNVTIVHPGAQADIQISREWQEKQYQAEVLSVGAAADPRTGNFEVRLLLQQPDPFIRPGMTARVAMKGQAMSKVLLLPESALVDRGRERVLFVFNPESGKVEQRTPGLIAGLGEQLLVMSGVGQGEQVVVQGAGALVDGAAVDVVDSRTLSSVRH